MPALSMLQIVAPSPVAPCPKRPSSPHSNQDDVVQDACHQELRQILTSSQTIKQSISTPKDHHLIIRTNNPLPQDMSFLTPIQSYLPTEGNRPRSFSVGDARHCIFIKKSSDLVH
ncbi:hypothetical protein BJV82DRAFT_633929 [Fennellomyces sp. T-0311]|nr:hypothetical protein BJV82DRAFT_633929 [Fennellomyces sp. T-0311]